MKRSLAIAALLVLGLCSSARAASRELEFELVYRVPPGCPEADVFLAGLNRHVAFGGSNYLQGAIVVTAVARGGFQLRMQFNGSRVAELHGDDCEQLVALAVRMAGMARTESPGERAEAQLEKAIEMAPEPVRWIEAQSGLEPEPGIDASSQPAVAVDAGPARPFEDSRPRAPRSDGSTSPSAWRPSLLVHGQWLTGALPRADLGWGVTLELAHRRWRARLEGTAWAEQQWTFLPGARPEAVSLSQQALALGLCYDVASAALGLGHIATLGCARGGGVRLRSERSDTYGAGATPYATAGARLGIVWQYGGLELGLLGGLDVVVGNRRLATESGGNEFVARAVQPGLSLSLGWQFGAPSPTRPEPSVEDVARAD